MKDQVFMSPNNGQLVVGIPLFRHFHGETIIEATATFGCYYTNENKPLAYVIHADKLLSPQVYSAEWVENKLINLGDL
jgi:hypothetical protein